MGHVCTSSQAVGWRLLLGRGEEAAPFMPRKFYSVILMAAGSSSALGQRDTSAGSWQLGWNVLGRESQEGVGRAPRASPNLNGTKLSDSMDNE